MPTNKELEQQVRELKKEIHELHIVNSNLRGVVQAAIAKLGYQSYSREDVVSGLEARLLQLDGYDALPTENAMQLIHSGHELEIVNLKRGPITDMVRRERGEIHIQENGKPRFIGKGDTVYVKITKYPEPVSPESDGVVEGGESEGG